MSTATATKNNALTASAREGHGKGAARSLRREGQIPAVIYGTNQAPQSIQLSEQEVTLVYKRGRFANRLIDIAVDGKTIQALPREVQMHPVSDRIEHVDFLRVEKGVEVLVDVPVKFLGAEKSPGLKRGGTLNVVRHEIAFFAKPENIPAYIEINIGDLDIGASVHIKDIKLPEGIRPQIKRNFTVATIAGRTAQTEETPTAAAATPAAGAAAPAAGAPAAGAPAAAAAPAAGKDAKK